MTLRICTNVRMDLAVNRNGEDQRFTEMVKEGGQNQEDFCDILSLRCSLNTPVDM